MSEKERVKFACFMSCSHNPAGSNMPEGKKGVAGKTCRKYSVPVIDDTVFSEIQYSRPARKTLKYYPSSGTVIEDRRTIEGLSPES